jgi:hypothetical protein
LQTARYRGQRNTWQVGAAAPTPPLSAALGFCLADGSLPRATECLAGGGCRPYTPAFRGARLVLQTARHRGQRSACHPARALANSHDDHDAASSFSRRRSNEMAVGIARNDGQRCIYTEGGASYVAYGSDSVEAPHDTARYRKAP